MFCLQNHSRVEYVAFLAVMVSIVVAIPGCWSRGGARTYPVKLKVSFSDGGIPEGAIVVCLSDSKADKTYSATGKVQADGTCQLSTFTQGDGAVVGRHLVTVAPAPAPPPTMSANSGLSPTAIPPRFGDKNSSGLAFVVTPEGPNDFSIQIERPTGGR